MSNEALAVSVDEGEPVRPVIVPTEAPAPVVEKPQTPEPKEADKAAPAHVDNPEATEPAEKQIKPIDPQMQRRLANEAYQRREAERALKAERDEKLELQRKLAAFQPAQETPANPVSFRSQEEFEQAVAFRSEQDQRARQEAARVEQFNAACNKTFESGKAKYADFEDALVHLGNTGALTPEVLSAIMETDEPDRILYDLGRDPEEAERVLKLPFAKLAVEMGKRSATKTVRATSLSKAPAPITPLSGSVRASVDPRDDDDDRTYIAKRIEQRKVRFGR